jgi:hypothetical protein
VGQKLGLATGLMFTLPLIAFFVFRSMFSAKEHPDNWAGGAAIVMTNVIVACYCYSALTEKDDDETKDNDEAQPRVGIYKQRTE